MRKNYAGPVVLGAVSIFFLAVWAFTGQLYHKSSNGIDVTLAYGHSLCNSLIGAYAQSLNANVRTSCGNINGDYRILMFSGIFGLTGAVLTIIWAVKRHESSKHT